MSGSRRALPLLAVLCAALAAASASVGPSGVTPLTLLASNVEPQALLILAEIRLPRMLLGLLVGASLGLSGAALQGLLRNPLADPGLLGISGSAAFGAVVAFYFGLGAATALAVPLGGLAGAAVGMTILVTVAGRGASTLMLILAGLAVSSIAAAATALALNLSPNPFALAEIVFWLMGSLQDRSMDQALLALPFAVVGCGLLLSTARGLDALSLGEEAAETLGVSPTALRWRVVAGSALAVGGTVAVTGAVGFVGLVVPHLLRPLVGHRPGPLLAASAVGGAVLVLTADVLVRLVPAPQEIKLGVATALVGAPFFLHLVLRRRHEVTP
ncbi:MAG: iron ABC transporter permease [Acetobacterales bacterium]